MRSAGCVINDFADRKVDGHVKRTKQRPLPSGRVTAKEAIGLVSGISRELIFIGVDHESTDDSIVVCGCCSGFHLPVCEALHPSSAIVFGASF